MKNLKFSSPHIDYQSMDRYIMGDCPKFLDGPDTLNNIFFLITNCKDPVLQSKFLNKITGDSLLFHGFPESFKVNICHSAVSMPYDHDLLDAEGVHRNHK